MFKHLLPISLGHKNWLSTKHMDPPSFPSLCPFFFFSLSLFQSLPHLTVSLFPSHLFLLLSLKPSFFFFSSPPAPFPPSLSKVAHGFCPRRFSFFKLWMGEGGCQKAAGWHTCSKLQRCFVLQHWKTCKTIWSYIESRPFFRLHRCICILLTWNNIHSGWNLKSLLFVHRFLICGSKTFWDFWGFLLSLQNRNMFAGASKRPCWLPLLFLDTCFVVRRGRGLPYCWTSSN